METLVNTSNYQKLLNWNNDLSDALIPNTVILALYILLAIGGNGVVLYIYKVRMEGNFTNRYFVPILAATDLLAATVCSSFQIAANLMQVIFFNTYLCKIWTLSAFTTYLSVLILLIIAVQRYLKVIKRAGRQMDLKFNRVALLCAFVVSALMAAPTMIFYGAVPVLSRDGFSIQGMRCSIIDGDNKVWFIIYGSVLGLLAIMIIIILTGVYMRIGWVIFRQMKLNKKYSKENAITTKESTDRDFTSSTMEKEHHANLEGNNICMETTKHETEANHQQNINISGSTESTSMDKTKTSQHGKINKRIMHKFTLMFMLITFIFVICYTPKLVILFVEALNPTFWEDLNDMGRAALLFVYNMYVINNISNPFVYAFLDRKFKTELKKLCCCCS